MARLTCASRIRRRSWTRPSRNPASISRTAASGSRPAVVGTVEISHLIPQPREIEHAIHTGEDVIVGHKLAQGTSDKQLQLIALLAPQHRSPRSSSLPQGNQSAAPAAKGLSAVL